MMALLSCHTKQHIFWNAFKYFDSVRWNNVEEQLIDTIQLFENNLVIWKQFEDNYGKVERWLSEKEEESEGKREARPEETGEERLKRLQECKVKKMTLTVIHKCVQFQIKVSLTGV